MKSSSSISVWDPLEFQPDNSVLTEENLAEILALFRPGQATPTQQALKDGREFIPANAAAIFDSWEPSNLSWVPPFAFDELGFVSPNLQPGSVPVEVSPTPEELAAEILAAARLQAEEIILQAQTTADDIILQAQAEINRAEEEARKLGYQDARAEAEDALHCAQATITEVTRWRHEMLAKSESTVVDIIRQIARLMFGGGVKLDETALQTNLNRVLEQAKALGDLRIFINPADAARLDPAWKEYQAILNGNAVFIIPSDGIKPGGCFVQGDMGSVDARVDSQLEAVLGVFHPGGIKAD